MAAYHSSRLLPHQPFRSACYAPFVGLSFDVHGTVSVCAFTRSTPLGRIGEDRLADMWTGPAITELRAAVRRDDLGRMCSRCDEEISGGNLHGVLATGFDRFTAEPSAPWPSRMEFALTNTCNLQCVMCSGEFSSAIRSHREGLPPLKSPYDESFLAELAPFLPHLEQARFLGGEPFLAPLNYRIWDLMIESGAGTECNVTTNGTQWNERIESVLDRLPFSVGISIDGVTRETVEKVRDGASFDRIMSNLDRFMEYRDRRGTSLSLTFCLMTDNWHEFGDYLRFAEERACQVYVNTVRQPPVHSLYHLPVEELRPVVARLEADRDAVAQGLQLNRNVWIEHIDRLRTHLEQLASMPPGALARDEAPDRYGALLERVSDPAAHESAVVEALRDAACDAEVSVLRCDEDGTVALGDTYLGLDLGRPGAVSSASLFELACAEFGRRVEVVAERITRGAPGRVIAYDEPGGSPTVVVVVTRQGPAPHSITKLGAVLHRGRPAPRRAVPVELGSGPSSRSDQGRSGA